MISSLVELEFKVLYGVGVAVCKGNKVIALLDLDRAETIECCYVLKLMRTLYKSSNKSSYKELVKAKDEKMFSFYYGYSPADLSNTLFQAYLKAKIGGVI